MKSKLCICRVVKAYIGILEGVENYVWPMDGAYSYQLLAGKKKKEKKHKMFLNWTKTEEQKDSVMKPKQT